ncbi:DUF4817 domain-containing protein, partial [Trichonephila clavipes]
SRVTSYSLPPFHGGNVPQDVQFRIPGLLCEFVQPLRLLRCDQFHLRDGVALHRRHASSRRVCAPMRPPAEDLQSHKQKYPGEMAPNASTTLFLQRLRDTGSVADRKRSGRAFIMKMKVADVETTLQRNPLERPSVYINIITGFISLLKVIKGTLGCRKTAQHVTHLGTVLDFSVQSGRFSHQLCSFHRQFAAVALLVHHDLRTARHAGLRRKIQLQGTGGKTQAQLRQFCTGTSHSISDADCCAVRPGFGSRRRRGCIMPAWHHTSSKILSEAGVKKGEETFEPPPGYSPPKLGGSEVKTYYHLHQGIPTQMTFRATSVKHYNLADRK